LSQKFATFSAAASSILILTVVPFTANGREPACQSRPVIHPPSLAAKLVRYVFGFALCSLTAAAPYSAHVVGTLIPYLSRMSLR
jgi:hypothetical protein